jgi:pimeloyl-ACP methyl ester carboxylesterase
LRPRSLRRISAPQPLPTRFTAGQLRALDIPVLALIAGRSVIHAQRAVATARKLLPRAQVELWPDASHAINGEYADEITQVATAFWQKVDGHRCFCSLPD